MAFFGISGKQVFFGIMLLVVVVGLMPFFVFLYTPQDAKPSPSPKPVQFQGQAVASARVLALKRDFYLSCNTSNAGFANDLKNVSGVENAFSVSATGVVLRFSSGLNESDFNASLGEALAFFKEDCVSWSLLRNADLEITSNNVTFFADDLTTQKTLYPRDLLDAFQDFGFDRVNGFVSLASVEGSEIRVSIMAFLQGDEFLDKPVVEEFRYLTEEGEVASSQIE